MACVRSTVYRRYPSWACRVHTALHAQGHGNVVALAAQALLAACKDFAHQRLRELMFSRPLRDGDAQVAEPVTGFLGGAELVHGVHNRCYLVCINKRRCRAGYGAPAVRPFLKEKALESEHHRLRAIVTGAQALGWVEVGGARLLGVELLAGPPQGPFEPLVLGLTDEAAKELLRQLETAPLLETGSAGSLVQ